MCHAASLYARRPDNLATDKKEGKNLASAVKYLVRAEECGLRLSSSASAGICGSACSFFLCLTSLSVHARVYLQGKADKCKKTTPKPKATTPAEKCIVTIWAKEEGNCAVCVLCV